MKLSNEAIDVLARSTVDGLTVFLPEGQLERPLYVEVNKALEAIGGKWSRKAKGHVFTTDPEAALFQVIATGEAHAVKGEFGFFPTPAPLAKRLVEIADIKPGFWVLEPSAGNGALLAALDARLPNADLRANTLAVEIQQPLADQLKADGWHVACADFLTIQPTAMFKFAVMNPPFDRRMVDIDHVMHAHRCLLFGGRLVSIMSNGVTFRQERKAVEFREFVAANNGRFHEVEDGAFKESGTMVRTVIVEMERAA